MSRDPRLHRSARRSLATVVVTAVVITVNHLYPLGLRALALGAVLVVIPTTLLLWFRNTRSTVPFIGYLLMNLWIVVGFGLIKGLWDSALPVFLGTLLSALSTSYPRPTLSPVWVELSGIATSIGSAFVAYYAYVFVRARRDATAGAESGEPTAPHRGVLAAGVVLVLAASVGAYVIADQDRWVAPPGGVVKIGVIVPTEGPYEMLGTSFLRAVEMAKADLPQTRYEYQLVVVDVGQDPGRARAAIQRAIRNDGVSAIVGGVSLFGQVTKPLATAARIPHTCVCTVQAIGDGAYNFINIPSPEAEATLWVQEALRRGVRRIALLTQDYPSIHNHVQALKAEALRVGLTIAYEWEFAESIKDFRLLVEQARAADPDVYYVEALSPQLDMLGRQLVDAKVRNLSSVVAPSLSEHSELFEGAWYTDSDLRDMGFRRRFEERYPGTRFATHMMPYAYDDFNMIVQAFERGENPAVHLRNITTYAGTAGTLAKERGRGNFQSRPAVWVIQNGKPTLTSNHSSEESQ